MRIAILGAGISGLAAGWFIKQRFGSSVKLSIYEKSHRPGGWIKSSYVDGFLFEEGPRSCRSQAAGAATLSLIESLGMTSEVTVAAPTAKKRYLLHEGKLQPIPGILGMLFSPLTRDIFPALWKEWWRSSVVQDNGAAATRDESIYNFISRRFNPEIAERLADPMTTGIYAGDIRSLSMRSCFAKIFLLEQEYGSVIKGMLYSPKAKKVVSPFVEKVQKQGAIFSLKHGMESLVSALASHLKDELILDTSIDAIELKEGKIWMGNAKNQSQCFDRVLCALPASAVLKLFEPILQRPYSFPATSVATVGMAWKEPMCTQKGFGYLVPTREKQNILGTVFDSAVFPEQSSYPHETRLTTMLGGMHHPHITSLSKEVIAALAIDAVRKHLNINKEPSVYHVSIANEAIPQYLVGHTTKVTQIKEDIANFSPHIKLLGAAWQGVAVNECIAEAAVLAQLI